MVRLHFSSNDKVSGSTNSNPVFAVDIDRFTDLFDGTRPVYVLLENWICKASPSYVVYSLQWVNMPSVSKQLGTNQALNNVVGLFSGGGAGSGRVTYALGQDTLGIPIRLNGLSGSKLWEFKLNQFDGTQCGDNDHAPYMFTLCLWQS